MNLFIKAIFVLGLLSCTVVSMMKFLPDLTNLNFGGQKVDLDQLKNAEVPKDFGAVAARGTPGTREQLEKSLDEGHQAQINSEGYDAKAAEEAHRWALEHPDLAILEAQKRVKAAEEAQQAEIEKASGNVEKLFFGGPDKKDEASAQAKPDDLNQ